MPNPERRMDAAQEARSQRGPVPLNDGLARRLSTYASAAAGALHDALTRPESSRWLVAGVTGVGVLALAAPANAGIVKGNAFQCCGLGISSSSAGHLRRFGSALWDVNGDGAADFAGRAFFSSVQNIRFASGSVRAENGGGFVPGLLGKGYEVGSKDLFSLVGGRAFGLSISGGGTGASSTGKMGYLGFRFDINGQLHYGWAYVDITTYMNYEPGYWLDASEVYYDTVPNQSIDTGETQVVPEPGTLGLLALGALGLGLWRRARRSPAR